MNVLVTGATGFVGRALVAALGQRGDTVRALVRDRATAAARRIENAGAECVPGDVLDEASIARAARGADVAFHCAGLVSYEAAREELEKANVVGTENVLAACKTAGVRRLVHVSTESVTSGNYKRSYVDEKFPQPARFLDAYSETKALAEDLVVAAHGSGIETVAIRPGWIWGPDDTSILPMVVRQVRAGKFAWVDGGRSLVATTYVKNLADALVLAAQVPEAGSKIYYVTDDERITIREFLGQMFSALGVRPPRTSIPYALAYAVAWAAEKVSSHPPITRALVAHAGKSYHFNVQRARKELGWAPAVTIRDGMKRLAVWAAKRGGPDAVTSAEVTEEPPEY